MTEEKVVHLEPKQVKYYDHAERMTKDDINEIITGINDDGTYEKETVANGLFGNGDERYYRYRTDYVNVNITILASIIIYLLAMFKMAYLLWQWFIKSFLSVVIKVNTSVNIPTNTIVITTLRSVFN